VAIVKYIPYKDYRLPTTCLNVVVMIKLKKILDTF
jgi:hypothetical protein